MSDDVSRQAPPKVVVSPALPLRIYLPTYLPTSVVTASEREVEERVVVAVVVAVAGALARNRRIVYLYLSLPAER